MKKRNIAILCLAVFALSAAVGGAFAAWVVGARLDNNQITTGSVDLKVTDGEGGTIPMSKTLKWVDVDYANVDYAALDALASANNAAKANFSVQNDSATSLDVTLQFDSSKYVNIDGVANSVVAWLYADSTESPLVNGRTAAELTTTFAHATSIAAGAKKSYTLFMVTPLSLQNGFAADKNFQFDVVATGTTGHSFVGNKTEYDASEGKFYRVCDNGCGTRGDEVPHHGNRYVVVNDVKYLVADCYSEANLDKGITYDPIKQAFTVPITDNYNGSYKIEAFEDDVILRADKDVTIGALTFTDGAGYVYNGLKVTGNHKITVKGSISVATVLSVECDMDLPSIQVGDDGKNNSVVIGNAENTVQPTVTVTASGGEGVNSSGWRDLDYKVLSGKLTVIQSDSGNVGISLHRANDVVTIGEHGALEINGFAVGIAAWDGGVGNASVLVYGALDVSALPGVSNGALKDVVVTVGNSENGYYGTLNLLSNGWGITGGTLNLVKGAAKLEYSNSESGFAAFNGMSQLTIRSGFALTITNFSVGTFNNAPTFDIDDDVEITVINMRDSNNDPEELRKHYK